MIHVEKPLCYLPNNGNAIYEFHPPKSRAGKRSISMSEQEKEVLQEQKVWHDDVLTRFSHRQDLKIWCLRARRIILLT